MAGEYKPRVNYCPLDDGDPCMSCIPCFKRAGATEVIKAEAPNKAMDLIRRLQEAAARRAALAGE